ncbi:cyclic nucleotide-binding domain-containing protein (plasmid) [Roseomonas mucosa]|nr:cyclic nucleotide-binding domain-containing protein [Roseomonas mucosa]
MQTAALIRSNPALAYPFPMLTQSAAGPAQNLPRVAGRFRRLERNAAIYEEGSRADHIYKVVSGTVRTCRFRMDGRRLIGQFALPGEVFGLDGMGQHRFTAEAVTDAVVAAFSRPDIGDYLGLTGETISRLFSAFRRSRLIADGGQHQVVILDHAGLEEQASEDEE